jgi:hypothetical protein
VPGGEEIFLLQAGTGRPTKALQGWTGAKGARAIFLSLFSTMAKKIFLWIYTFQEILRRFHPYDIFFQNF